MNNHTVKHDWVRDMLQQFDAAAQDYLFPMPNNFSLYNAGMRLTAFRSDVEWLIVFQMINYEKSHTFADNISVYGNLISERGMIAAKDIVKPVQSATFWDASGAFILDRFRFTVAVKQKVYTFDVTEEEYRNAGIDIHSRSPKPVQILRMIAHKRYSELFLEDDELLAICGRVDMGLTRFLQLDEWHHPDIADDELPSENPCFRSIAEALAHNNQGMYHCPQESVNTHWSYWELDEHRGWE